MIRGVGLRMNGPSETRGSSGTCGQQSSRVTRRPTERRILRSRAARAAPPPPPPPQPDPPLVWAEDMTGGGGSGLTHYCTQLGRPPVTSRGTSASCGLSPPCPSHRGVNLNEGWPPQRSPVASLQHFPWPHRTRCAGHGKSGSPVISTGISNGTSPGGSATPPSTAGETPP